MKELAAAEHKAHTFAPVLSPASAKLCPKGADVAELFKDTRRAKAHAAAVARAAEANKHTLTFRPNTAPSRASRRLHAEASALPRVACADASQLSARIKALQEARFGGGGACRMRPLRCACAPAMACALRLRDAVLRWRADARACGVKRRGAGVTAQQLLRHAGTASCGESQACADAAARRARAARRRRRRTWRRCARRGAKRRPRRATTAPTGTLR
jgi:hypothetical protein